MVKQASTDRPVRIEMESGRLEAFSDGVFAIASTLLVLEIRVPEASSELARDLVRLWPSYLAYVVSFLLIGVVWLNHHTMFHYIERVDRWLLVFNLLLLLNVAFLPFPTAVLAEAIATGEGPRPAVLLYGGSLVVGGVFFNAVWLYASWGHRLLGDHITPAEAAALRRRFLPGPVVYAVAALVGLLNATASLVLYGLLLVVYMFERPPRVADDDASG
jgi:uncharacterized membrane protein